MRTAFLLSLMLVCSLPACTVEPGPVATAIRADALGARAEEPGLVAQLRAAAVPLATDAPGAPLDDLAAFAPAFHDARVIGLGENSHGTREVFRLKHRFVELLARDHGVRVFALEANFATCLPIDRYVKTGEGDLARFADLLGGQHGYPYGTEEVLELIRWMRAWNAAGKPQLSFVGVDMQNAYAEMASVAALARKVGPTAANAVEPRYATFQRLGFPSYAELPAAQRASIRQDLEAVVAWLDENRGAIVAATSVEAFRDARRSAVVVTQAEGAWAAGRGYAARRDAAMAENVRWAIEEAYPGAKAALWAHDAHVSDDEGMMGAHLRERYRRSYYVLGFTSFEGTFLARPRWGGKFPVAIDPGPARAGTVDEVFHRVGRPMFALDLRALPPSSPLGRWLATPRARQSFGAVYFDEPAWVAENRYQELAWAQAFDGFVHVDRTTPSRLVRQAP